MRRPLLILFAIALAVSLGSALSGCGGSGRQAAPTRLTIHYWPRGQGQPGAAVWSLRCAPPGGSHPRPAAACALLASASARAALGPTPPGSACSMIYGGPEVAQIQGTRNGRPLSTRVTRADGCEIARWQNLVPLLPAPSRTG